MSQSRTPFVYSNAVCSWVKISPENADKSEYKNCVYWVKDGDVPPNLAKKTRGTCCIITVDSSRGSANNKLMRDWEKECAHNEKLEKALIYYTQMIVPVKCSKLDKVKDPSDPLVLQPFAKGLDNKKVKTNYKVIYLRHVRSPISSNNILQDVFVFCDTVKFPNTESTTKKKKCKVLSNDRKLRSEYDFIPKKDKMYDPVTCEKMELCCEQDALDLYETVLLGYYIKPENERSSYKNKYFKAPADPRPSGNCSTGKKKCYNADLLCGVWLGNSELDKQKACLNKMYGFKVTS